MEIENLPLKRVIRTHSRSWTTARVRTVSSRSCGNGKTAHTGSEARARESLHRNPLRRVGKQRIRTRTTDHCRPSKIPNQLRKSAENLIGVIRSGSRPIGSLTIRRLVDSTPTKEASRAV